MGPKQGVAAGTEHCAFIGAATCEEIRKRQCSRCGAVKMHPDIDKDTGNVICSAKTGCA